MFMPASRARLWIAAVFCALLLVWGQPALAGLGSSGPPGFAVPKDPGRPGAGAGAPHYATPSDPSQGAKTTDPGILQKLREALKDLLNGGLHDFADLVQKYLGEGAYVELSAQGGLGAGVEGAKLSVDLAAMGVRVSNEGHGKTRIEFFQQVGANADLDAEGPHAGASLNLKGTRFIEVSQDGGVSIGGQAGLEGGKSKGIGFVALANISDTASTSAGISGGYRVDMSRETFAKQDAAQMMAFVARGGVPDPSLMGIWADMKTRGDLYDLSHGGSDASWHWTCDSATSVGVSIGVSVGAYDGTGGSVSVSYGVETETGGSHWESWILLHQAVAWG